MGRNRGSVKLKKSERDAWLQKLQFLSDAMEATSQPFCAGSPDGFNLIFNKAFCDLTGYSREELHALSWATDLTPPESRMQELEFLKILDRTHEPQRYEKDYVRKDGRVIPIELFTHAAPDSKGRVLFYYTFATDISERKRKEHELRAEELSRNEERLQMLIETSPVPMVVFGPDNKLSLNKKFVETFGYTPEDLPTLDRWWPLAYPDEEYRKFVKDRWEAAIGPAIANRASTGGRDVVVRCKDGSKRRVLSYFSSIGDLNLSVFYDVTDRMHAEEALRNSEAMLAKSQEMAHIGSWVWDVETGDIHRTDESYRIFGLIPGKYMITFEKFLDFIVPEDREYVANQTRLSMKSGMPYDITYRIRREDGAIRVLHSWGEPVMDESGRVVKMFGTNQDVTERRQAEEVQRSTLYRFYDILSNMRTAVLLVTGEDRVEFANRAFCNYFELREPPASLAGLTAAELIDRIKNTYGDPAAAVARIREIVSQSQPIIGEEVAIRGGRTCLRDYIPLGGNGEMSGRLWVHLDITERKRAEKELEEAKQQAELYLDLMGHDISNMHQIIMMQLELALSVLDEEGRLELADREMFTTSLTTLDRSVNLIGNVRMLQKVRSGEYQAESLDLDHVIESAVKIYSDIPGRNVTIKYAPVSGHMVMASPLVKDVLANLVDNAIKHSKDPVEIGIGVRRVMYKGIPYYRVAVEDNGIGVPDEKKDLIFQRFKRGQTMAKGTGLGLYIVRTLVEGFGGCVRLEDRVSGDYKKGARFVVYLPAAEANDGR